MKKLLLVGCLVATSVMADHLPQQFYRAHDGKNLIEAGWIMSPGSYEYDDGTTEDDGDISTTDFSVAFSRGLNKDMAIGLKLNQRTDSSASALTDHEIFFEGSKDDFFYGLSLFLDGGEYEDGENFSRGAMTYNLTLGYVFMKNYGVRLDYTPGWSTAVKDVDDDTDFDANMDIAVFYERMMGDKTIGASLGQRTVGDASDDDDAQTWTDINLYGVIPVGMVDVTAGLRYEMGSTDNNDITVQGLDVGVRYTF